MYNITFVEFEEQANFLVTTFFSLARFSSFSKKMFQSTHNTKQVYLDICN